MRKIDAALSNIDETTLRGRFAPDKMMSLDIYPNIWDRDPVEDDSFSYCVENFSVLKQFIAQASSKKLGIVIYLT